MKKMMDSGNIPNIKREYPHEEVLVVAHEAGHSVFGAIFDIPMEYVEVTTKKIRGVEYISGYSSNIPHEVTMRGMSKDEKERYGVLWWISSAAGIAAEMLLGETNRTKQWKEDIRQLIAFTENTDINIPIAIVMVLFSEYPGICDAQNIIFQKLLTERRIDGVELQTIVDSKVTRKEKNEIKNKIWNKLLPPN